MTWNHFAYMAVGFVFVGFFVVGCQSFRYYDPDKPHHGQNGFLNNYDNSPAQNFWKWQWERWTKDTPKEPPFEPEILEVDLKFLKSNRTEKTLTWIGHSSFLLQVGGLNVLTDPVFSDRVSPVSFAGPKRLVKLPIEIAELPPIDVVVVSHNHYDHLDIDSLKELAKKSGKKTQFFVPLGDGDLLKKSGIENVHEFDWWQNTEVAGVRFTFTPTQHWSARGLFDRNQCLWGGWSIQNPQSYHVFFAGDTGYSKDFLDTKNKLGAVDLALLPIGAYGPRWFMKKNHVSPAEAVQIHRDLESKKSIGIHWGTFRLSDEPVQEPAEILRKSLEEAQISESDFGVMKHGETLRLEQN